MTADPGSGASNEPQGGSTTAVTCDLIAQWAHDPGCLPQDWVGQEPLSDGSNSRPCALSDVTVDSDRADDAEMMMTDILTRDADKLHRALARGGDEVRLTVSRETAEWMSQLVDAKVSGRDVVLTNDRGEVTPTQAGQMLGISRPQVRKLMDDGRLDFRKVGTHHRITVASIQAFLVAERERRAPPWLSWHGSRTMPGWWSDGRGHGGLRSDQGRLRRCQRALLPRAAGLPRLRR